LPGLAIIAVDATNTDHDLFFIVKAIAEDYVNTAHTSFSTVTSSRNVMLPIE
jgi:hypothetical protein